MADFEQVVTKLDIINDKVDELLQWKAAMDERCFAHRQQTDELRNVVFSNPGLKSKVERLWNGRANITKWRDFWLHVLRVLITTAIIGAVGWLLIVFKNIN